ncbi:ATH1 [Cyberlindnera jadinii]|uniref:alpha,alpha-trehalase n=2 Tax=Cyberlindnera jadinii (strain ATCC 18201 / CBS 1600 / BCRC 20928 / JCM 3617 / NBRC 0987 / NRRL Y-1542) TaxID=983966 RepID=A0A0H5CL04_CYBJN|nr:ATH1 [Cyberlindnera jadinii]
MAVARKDEPGSINNGGSHSNLRSIVMLVTIFMVVPLALLWSTTAGIEHKVMCKVRHTAHVIKHDIHRFKQMRELCRRSEKMFELVADASNSFYDSEENVLGSLEYIKNVYSKQPYVSNGYIGARLSTLGHGFTYDELNLHSNDNETHDPLVNGWPLFNKRYTGAFVAGFYSLQETLPATNFPELYSQGYDSVMASIPYWAQLDVIFEDETGEHVFNPQGVDPMDITGYNQNMSLHNGVVHTSLTWLNKLEIDIEVFVHKKVETLAVMGMSIRPINSPMNVTLRDSLDFQTSQRSWLKDLGADDEGIYMVVQPENVPTSKAAVFSSWDVEGSHKYVLNRTRVVNEGTVELFPHEVALVNKYVGVVSTEFHEKLDRTELEHAKITVEYAHILGRDTLLQMHKEEWEQYFEETNIFFPSDSMLTVAAQASLFHLISNTNVNSRGLSSALGTAGLSSDSYGGMVFWDTDLWIIPGIVPFAPDVANAVSNYRNYTHPQAVLNAQQYGYEGAAYPWTSGRFGNCTSAGPCVDYEYHINVDIALSSYLLYLAGEDEEYLRFTTWPLLRDAADFLTQYTKFDPELGLYTTSNLTDPDEYANHIDNGAFTNAGIDRLLNLTITVADHLGVEKNPRWEKVHAHIYIPKSESGIVLEYSGMNSSVRIKQADVVMLTVPLNYKVESHRQESIDNMLYYSLKQVDMGPAMTFPVFSMASRRLISYGCSSQSYLQKSVLPYVRLPFAQFSEQADDNVLTNGGTHPAFPFLTAHGGFLQAIVHGILGLKYSARVDPASNQIERYLAFDPVRPLALPGGVVLNGFKYMGQVLDVTLTDFTATIKHRRGLSPITVEVNERNERSGNYTLRPHSTLTVPIYNPPLNIPGSCTECQQIANLTCGSPAEVPLSAIDGNNYTYWQPINREPARLLIDLGKPQIVQSGLMIWGHRPPKYLSIYASYDLTTRYEDMLATVGHQDFFKLVDRLEVAISEPYNPEHWAEVRLLPNNETSFEIINDKPVKYIVVEVEDAIDEQGQRGATINEIALFPMKKSKWWEALLHN